MDTLFLVLFAVFASSTILLMFATSIFACVSAPNIFEQTVLCTLISGILFSVFGLLVANWG